MCKFILFMSFCILLGAGTRLGNGSLVVTPKNVAVVAGQKMIMECRTDNKSLIRGWSYSRNFDNPSTSTVVFAHRTPASTAFNSTRSGFGIEVDKSSSVFLYSNATQVEDAGIYTCRAETGLEQKEIASSAALIVFHNEIMCETNTSEDHTYVVMRCKVQFRGRWSPIVEWEQHGTDSNETYLVTNVNDSNNNSDKSITSSILVDLRSIKCDSFFSFKTYFQWHNTSLGVTARNIPEFSHIWNSPPLNVCPSMMKESFYTYMYIYLLYAIIGIVCLVTAVVIVCIVLRRETAGSSSMELDKCQDQTEITEPFRMELDILYQEVTETTDWSSGWDTNEFQMINGCSTADHDIYQDEIEIAGCSTAEHYIYQDETEIADEMMAYSTYRPDAEDGLLFDNTIRFMGQEPAEPDSIGLYAEAECLD